MKTRLAQRLFWALSCMLCLSPILSAAAKTKIYEAGLVLSKMGEIVLVTDEKGNKVTARQFLKIVPGYKIETGPNSHAMLTSVTGDTYAMEENSEMEISLPLAERLSNLKNKQSDSMSKENTMSFLKGRIQTHVKPGQSKIVNIKTAVNILSVKGTTFAVTIDHGEVILDVLEGQVDMLDLWGKNPISVMAGMRANSSNKKPKAIPKQNKEEMEQVQRQSKQTVDESSSSKSPEPPKPAGQSSTGTPPPPPSGTSGVKIRTPQSPPPRK